MANEDKKILTQCSTIQKICQKSRRSRMRKASQNMEGTNVFCATDRIRQNDEKVPKGKLLTIQMIRNYFAKENGADFTDPITPGIFVSIAAWASHQRNENPTPYWRTLKAHGELNAKYPGGIQAQKKSSKQKDLRFFKKEERIFVIMSKIMKRP